MSVSEITLGVSGSARLLARPRNQCEQRSRFRVGNCDRLDLDQVELGPTRLIEPTHRSDMLRCCLLPRQGTPTEGIDADAGEVRRADGAVSVATASVECVTCAQQPARAECGTEEAKDQA